jgi:hypothetical protein
MKEDSYLLLYIFIYNMIEEIRLVHKEIKIRIKLKLIKF